MAIILDLEGSARSRLASGSHPQLEVYTSQVSLRVDFKGMTIIQFGREGITIHELMIGSEQKGYYGDKGQKLINTNLLPQLSPTRREVIFELSRRHMSRTTTSRW